MTTLYRKRRKLTFEEMTREELIDCIETLGDKHLLKMDEEHWIGCMGGHLCNDDEQGVELNQININGYWINCPLYFIDHNVVNIMKNYDYALEYDLVFSRIDNEFELRYYSKEGELMAITPYHTYPYYDECLGGSDNWLLLKKALIYLETMELYFKIKQLLIPDLQQCCILTYCDMMGDLFLRNIKIV